MQAGAVVAGTNVKAARKMLTLHGFQKATARGASRNGPIVLETVGDVATQRGVSKLTVITISVDLSEWRDVH